jgi:hypothetical protein
MYVRGWPKGSEEKHKMAWKGHIHGMILKGHISCKAFIRATGIGRRSGSGNLVLRESLLLF